MVTDVFTRQSAATLKSAALVEEIEAATRILDQLEVSTFLARPLLSVEAAAGRADPTTSNAVEQHDELLHVVASSSKLTSELIRTWHVALTEGTGWPIGAVGPDLGTEQSAAVTQRFVDDIVNYGNRSLDHPIIKAATMYAETRAIQPFTTGNGRLARLLVFWALGRRWRVLPPISQRWAADSARHAQAYETWRTNPEDWLRTFTADLRSIGSASQTLCGELTSLQEQWLDAAPGRAGSLRRQLLMGLIERPTIDSAVARDLYEADATRFSRVARELVRDGVLVAVPQLPDGVGRPRLRYGAPAVNAVLDQWMAALRLPSRLHPGWANPEPAPLQADRASESSGTATKPPGRGRPVPSKVRRPSVS